MARQTGPLKYKGTLGDVRHFKIKGLTGHYAGMVGGPTGDQIKSAPEFARTRENMNEFGGSAAAAKSVRAGLAQLMKQMSDSQLTGRLTGIMKKINLEDQSEARGQRAILISQQGQYLKGLAFNKNVSFDGIFYAPYAITNPSRIESTLAMNDFVPANFINAPAGATHFRIINALSVISDFQFDDQSKTYVPVSPALNELSVVEYSDYKSLTAAGENNISLVAALPGTPTLNANVSVLASVGIEFYQQVGTTFYLFNSGNALKIAEIF